jgi:hypothetical protein
LDRLSEALNVENRTVGWASAAAGGGVTTAEATTPAAIIERTVHVRWERGMAVLRGSVIAPI